jgi:hypothetical protein
MKNKLLDGLSKPLLGEMAAVHLQPEKFWLSIQVFVYDIWRLVGPGSPTVDDDARYSQYKNSTNYYWLPTERYVMHFVLDPFQAIIIIRSAN